MIIVTNGEQVITGNDERVSQLVKNSCPSSDFINVTMMERFESELLGVSIGERKHTRGRETRPTIKLIKEHRMYNVHVS